MGRSRMLTLCVFVTIVAAAAVAAAAPKAKGAAPAAGAKVEVAGLSVARPMPGDKFGRSMARGIDSGTTVALRIVQPAKTMVRVDEDASKLEAFADDQGTDLSKTASRFGPRWLSWGSFSEDGHTYRFSIVNSKKVPAAGTKHVHVKARIAVECGSDVKTAEAKDVALKKGTALTVGPLKMTVGDVKDGGFQSKMTVELSSKQPFTAVRKVTFLGPDGKVIKHRGAGSGSWSVFGKAKTYTVSYGLAEKVDTVTVRFEYYGKVEKITVPIDVKVGLGL